MIDLYGQCAEVTLTSGSGVRRRENNIGSTQNMTNAAIATAVTGIPSIRQTMTFDMYLPFDGIFCETQ